MEKANANGNNALIYYNIMESRSTAATAYSQAFSNNGLVFRGPVSVTDNERNFSARFRLMEQLKRIRLSFDGRVRDGKARERNAHRRRTYFGGLPGRRPRNKAVRDWRCTDRVSGRCKRGREAPNCRTNLIDPSLVKVKRRDEESSGQ